MRTLRAGRRPAAWRRIGRAEHALALWLACSAGTASAADSGASQGATAAPLKVGAGARGGHAHAPGRVDGLLLPVHPRLEHARHQRGLLGWLQRVGVHCAGCGRGVGCGRAKSGERPHSADLGGAAPMMPSEAEPMPVRANNWARDTPFPAGTRAESAAFCPLLFSAAACNVDRQARKSFLGFTCGRRHGGGTHWRPLWYIWRGSPQARGSPGLTAAVVGRAHPCRPPADPGLNPPSPPTPTDRRENSLPVGLTGQVGLSLPPGPGVGLRFRGGAAAAPGSEYRDPLKTLNPKP